MIFLNGCHHYQVQIQHLDFKYSLHYFILIVECFHRSH